MNRHINKNKFKTSKDVNVSLIKLIFLNVIKKTCKFYITLCETQEFRGIQFKKH